jgi:hypothetical protein
MSIRSVGGQSPDPELRMRTFAKSRGEGVQNYRMLPTGEIVRRGKDGIFYSETPSAVKNTAANVLSTSNVVGGVLSAPALEVPGWGVPLAAGIEAGTEAATRAYARNVLGEKGSKTDAYVIRPLIRGTIAGATGAVAKIGTGGARLAGNKAARGIAGTGEVGRIVKANEVVDSEAIQATARNFTRFGVEGNTPQVTKSPALAAVHQYVGELPTAAGESVRAAQVKQEGQVAAAMAEGRGGLPKFTGEPQAAAKGRMITDVAGEAHADLLARRKAVTKPLFKTGFEEAHAAGNKIDIQPTLSKVKDLMDNAPDAKQRNLWKSVYNDLFRTEEVKGNKFSALVDKNGHPIPLPSSQSKPVLKSTIEDLDGLQKSIRRETTSRQNIDKYGNLMGQLADIRQSMLEDIGKAAPTYLKAVEKYGAYSRAIRGFEGEIAGSTKDSTFKRLMSLGPDQYHQAPGILFGKETSPATITNVRTRILNRVPNGAEKWGEMERASMTDAIGGLQKSLEIPDWKMANLKAALGGANSEKFKAVEAFQQLLKDVGYTPKLSRTPSASKGFLVLQREVGGAKARIIQRATFSPWIQGRIMSTNAIEKAAPKIAEELSTGSGIAKLLRLKQLPSGSRAQKAAALLSYLGLDTYGKARLTQENKTP